MQRNILEIKQNSNSVRETGFEKQEVFGKRRLLKKEEQKTIVEKVKSCRLKKKERKILEKKFLEDFEKRTFEEKT